VGGALFIAAPQDNMPTYDIYYRGTAIAVHPTYITVRWRDFREDASNPEDVPRDSYRLWHGHIAKHIWEDMRQGADFAYAPKSRILFPDTFAEIAQQHGLPPPAFLPPPAAGAPRSNGVHHAAAIRATSSHVQAPARAVSPSDSADEGTAARSESQWQQAGAAWLQAVRAYGKRLHDWALVGMPTMLAMRRNMHLHPFALWTVVQVRHLSLGPQ
jgi:hypothetical protein